ncbi:hypothetical protein KKG48_02335, partial [Patescibacteria group bacterium]|nr:hypothetical protein [Patescibacteria group bacterium]
LFFVLSLSRSTSKEESISNSDFIDQEEINIKNNRNNTYIGVPDYKINQHEINELGLVFNYPDFFVLKEIKVNEGQTGKKLVGYLDFSNKYRINFGGVTRDFSKSRGGSLNDTFGYKKLGSDYYLNFVWNDYKLSKNEFSLINDNSIIVSGKEIGFILSDDTVVAFTNTLDQNFPGIVFSVSSLENKILNKEEIVQIFKETIPLISFNQI